MGYSNSVYKAASDTLHERRLNAEKAAERRKEEVYKKFPRVKELEKDFRGRNQNSPSSSCGRRCEGRRFKAS